MRRSHWINLGMVGFLLASPFIAHAASTALTSIIPGASSGSVCLCPGSAPDWGCVLQTLQNIMNDVVGFAAIIISLFIAQAGFTYMTSGGNPEKRQLANKRILNAVIGLVIVLCAWLLVDSIMKIIYNPNAPLNGSTFGPWNSILVSDGSDYCIKQQSSPGALAAIGQITQVASNAGGGTPPANLSNAGGACSATAIESAVQAEGGTIAANVATTLACVAGPESSCGANPKALVPQNNGSSALGPFQVTVQSHASLFNNPQCEAVAGSSGPLNCQTAFSGGNPISGTALTQCEAAADDLGCEALVAAQVYQTEGIGAWTADSRSTTQGSCGN